MTTHHHAMADLGFVEKYLAPRWKAITAFAVTLLGALAQMFPNGTAVHATYAFVTMIAATFGVHQIANVPAPTSVANVVTDVEEVLPAMTTTGTTSVPATSLPSSALSTAVPDDDAPGA